MAKNKRSPSLGLGHLVGNSTNSEGKGERKSASQVVRAGNWEGEGGFKSFNLNKLKVTLISRANFLPCQNALIICFPGSSC